jgi:hypothetical protein
MKKWLKGFVHNSLVHPVMPFIPVRAGDFLHDRTGRWAFPEELQEEQNEEAPCSSSRRSRFVLHSPAGEYSAHHFTDIVIEVILHRTHHWRNGEGWVD